MEIQLKMLESKFEAKMKVLKYLRYLEIKWILLIITKTSEFLFQDFHDSQEQKFASCVNKIEVKHNWWKFDIFWVNFEI